MTLFAQFVEPSGGYAADKEQVKSLELEAFYEVSSVEMGQSSTAIKLVGSRDRYNSVHFKFFKSEDGEYKEHDIFKDPDYNPYIRSRSWYGV